VVELSSLVSVGIESSRDNLIGSFNALEGKFCQKEVPGISPTFVFHCTPICINTHMFG